MKSICGSYTIDDTDNFKYVSPDAYQWEYKNGDFIYSPELRETAIHKANEKIKPLLKDCRELIIVCGSPSSGKTTYCKELSGKKFRKKTVVCDYGHLNSDDVTDFLSVTIPKENKIVSIRIVNVLDIKNVGHDRNNKLTNGKKLDRLTMNHKAARYEIIWPSRMFNSKFRSLITTEQYRADS